MPSLTRKSATAKPEKPYAEFPLFPHATKRWAKKIRGQLHYFGPWDDPMGALERYKEQADDLHAGRTPRPKADGLQLHELVNRFLTVKQGMIETGELRQSTFNEYHRTCGQVVEFFGRHRLVSDIRPDDFARLRGHLAKGLGLGELGKRIGIVRSLFKYGTENELITHAVVFGTGFKKPSLKALRREHVQAPSRMLTAAELRKLLKAAGVQLKAMIHLALNCGYGNTDLSELPTVAVDLKAGWARFPRPKTGIMRKAPLWNETRKAIEKALVERPHPKDPADAGRLFITSHGSAWVRHQPSKKTAGAWTWTDAINLEFGKLLGDLEVKRPGVSFYSLRHVFRTVADEVNDRGAIDAIMGHAPEADDMGPRYVDRIEEGRLRRVTDHVHAWLFPPKQRKQSSTTPTRG